LIWSPQSLISMGWRVCLSPWHKILWTGSLH